MALSRCRRKETNCYLLWQERRTPCYLSCLVGFMALIAILLLFITERESGERGLVRTMATTCTSKWTGRLQKTHKNEPRQIQVIQTLLHLLIGIGIYKHDKHYLSQYAMAIQHCQYCTTCILSQTRVRQCDFLVCVESGCQIEHVCMVVVHVYGPLPLFLTIILLLLRQLNVGLLMNNL